MKGGTIKMEKGEFVDVNSGFNWNLTEERLNDLILWHLKEEAVKNGIKGI